MGREGEVPRLRPRVAAVPVVPVVEQLPLGRSLVRILDQSQLHRRLLVEAESLLILSNRRMGDPVLEKWKGEEASKEEGAEREQH